MDFDATRTAMADLDEEALLKAVNDIMSSGGEGADKAVAACQEGMEIVGERLEGGEYFVGDLIYAGEIMTEAMRILAPALGSGSESRLSRMILCTVQNDLHDIGKNLVRAMLEAGGFEVIDLGIDVAPEKIVSAAKEQDIKIIALSGVLTLALDSMRRTVEEFSSAGLRERVKIIIGGNPVSEEMCKTIGADEWAHSPQKSVQVCREWAGA